MLFLNSNVLYNYIKFVRGHKNTGRGEYNRSIFQLSVFSEQNRKREVELVESGNFGSNRYSVSERLGARFTVRNLSIGSNYSGALTLNT